MTDAAIGSTSSASPNTSRKARGDSEIAKAADTALIKITDGMGGDDAAQMLANGLTVSPFQSNRREELATIRRAMRDRRKLQIAYHT